HRLRLQAPPPRRRQGLRTMPRRPPQSQCQDQRTTTEKEGRLMRHATALARTIHRDQGVGFWSREDAEGHATLERARTGQLAEVVPVQSPMHTHVLWFVRL